MALEQEVNKKPEMEEEPAQDDTGRPGVRTCVFVQGAEEGAGGGGSV